VPAQRRVYAARRAEAAAEDSAFGLLDGAQWRRLLERNKGEYIAQLRTYPLADHRGRPSSSGAAQRMIMRWSASGPKDSSRLSHPTRWAPRRRPRCNRAVRRDAAEVFSASAQCERSARGPADEDLMQSPRPPARDGGHQLTDDESRSAPRALLLAFAGHYSTVQLLSGMNAPADQQPDSVHPRPSAKPSLKTSAVRKNPLRLVQPAPVSSFRTTKSPVSIGDDDRSPSRQMIFAHLGGANRESQRSSPARPPLTVGRSPNRATVGFGHDRIHYCRGARWPGAARQLMIVLAALLRNTSAHPIRDSVPSNGDSVSPPAWHRFDASCIRTM
jgi:hypothetical protein